MIVIDNYITAFSKIFHNEKSPWEITAHLDEIIIALIQTLDSNFAINNNIAIHKTATIENGTVIKSPAIIGNNCFVGVNACLRNGVYLADGVKIGTGCEIKSSIIFSNSAIAHFNFIGDSIIGSNVNFEAGSVTANHYNERMNKQITVLYNGELLPTGVVKFGALVGDDCKIGANAVLSPGTLLLPNTVVKRLALIEQVLS